MRLPDGRVARYRYDAFARRVSKELIPKERTEFATALAIAAEKGPEALPPIERTEFLWDGDVLCEERALAVPVVRPGPPDDDVAELAPHADEAAGSAPPRKRVFVHEPDTFLPMLQQEGGKTYAYVLDHLGTPKELIDERGRVAWSAAYSAWGRIVETAKDRGTVAVESPFRLLGQYEDRETGLRYTRYRYFEAETGRWLSPDPSGLLGGNNLLAFDGSPSAVADPRGLACEIHRLGRKGRVKYKGIEVRRVHDLDHLSLSTLRAMAQLGFAAKDKQGQPIVLHHHKQNPNGPIVELPAPQHQIGNPNQHPFGNQKGAGLTAQERADFNAWRENYWKARAREELARRGEE